MDCLYHGYSGGPGGQCLECEEEEVRCFRPGTIQPDSDIVKARIETHGRNPLVHPEVGNIKKRSQ